MNYGIPNLQTGLLVGLENDPVAGSQHVPQICHQEYQHQHVNQQAKNRERAAAHQAKLKAASSSVTSKVLASSSAVPAVDQFQQQLLIFLPRQ